MIFFPIIHSDNRFQYIILFFIRKVFQDVDHITTHSKTMPPIHTLQRPVARGGRFMDIPSKILQNIFYTPLIETIFIMTFLLYLFLSKLIEDLR